MQAIWTKFIGATNHKASRVKATAEAGSITIEWDHSLNPDENHDAAAFALCRKLGWLPRRLVSGGRPDKKGNCYCIINKGGNNVLEIRN